MKPSIHTLIQRGLCSQGIKGHHVVVVIIEYEIYFSLNDNIQYDNYYIIAEFSQKCKDLVKIMKMAKFKILDA